MKIIKTAKFINSQSVGVGYHITSKNRLYNIRKNGLILGSEPNLTNGSKDFFGGSIYGGIWPIFCLTNLNGLAHREFNQSDSVILQINASGLKIAADIPTLIHPLNGLLSETSIYWESNFPEELRQFESEDSELSLYDLENDAGLINACINLTSSFAVLDSIPINRIKFS